MVDAVPHHRQEVSDDDHQHNEDDDCYLSNHCIAMRKALHRCLLMSNEVEYLSLRMSSDSNLAETSEHEAQRVTGLLDEAQRAARSVKAYRAENLEAFHALMAATAAADPETEGKDKDRNAIAVVDKLDQHSPHAFRRKFEHANLPCKISRLPAGCFDGLGRELVLSGGENGSSEDGDCVAVNRSWFLDRLGAEATVPVRVEPLPVEAKDNAEINASSTHLAASENAGGLDGEGRATECQTKIMTMRQWIDYLDASNDRRDGHSRTGSPLYLKDWHLQSILCRQNRTLSASLSSTTMTTTCRNVDATIGGQGAEVAGWYNVPAHFGHDILNHFLTTFFVDDNGYCNSDYYFCYWGPAGSRTVRHSDVLNSFSWSYSVSGRKLWTFYPPPSVPSNLEMESGRSQSTPVNTAIVLYQEAGECVFVPSGWQHSVINCEEALSLNHNWVTTANVDLVWSCVCQEMEAIERELASWMFPVTNASNPSRQDEPSETEANGDTWDARESMLRGCVGLDVTAFYLMVTFALLDLLLLRPPAANSGTDDAWEFAFDATRLRDALDTILTQSDSIQLAQRLRASLSDPALAHEALKLGETAIEQTDTRLREFMQ